MFDISLAENMGIQQKQSAKLINLDKDVDFVG